MCVEALNMKPFEFIDLGQKPYGNYRQAMIMVYLQKHYEDKNTQYENIEKEIKKVTG